MALQQPWSLRNIKGRCVFLGRECSLGSLEELDSIRGSTTLNCSVELDSYVPKNRSLWIALIMNNRVLVVGEATPVVDDVLIVP